MGAVLKTLSSFSPCFSSSGCLEMQLESPLFWDSWNTVFQAHMYSQKLA